MEEERRKTGERYNGRGKRKTGERCKGRGEEKNWGEM